MKRLAPLFQNLFGYRTQPAGPLATRQQVQALLDDLEDPPPANGLLLNLATGFPSALLCVLAAGLLAGALAGRHVGGARPPAAAGPAALAQPVVFVAEASQGSNAVPAGTALLGRHAQLEALELQALQGGLAGTPIDNPAQRQEQPPMR